MDWATAIVGAEGRIRSCIRQTPAVHCAALAADHGVDVVFKLENEQVTGSFKARGALHKLLVLGEAERAHGVVAASSGNHGAAVAWAARTVGCPAVIWVPEGTSASKVAAIRQHGAEVRLFGQDCVVTEGHARREADTSGRAYVSPYNDVDVIAGQGTVALELTSQVDGLDAVFIAVGGGGLIGGMGAWFRARAPSVKVIACSPERSPAMHACLEAGNIVEIACHSTLSDATAGGVEEGAITFPLCRDVIDASELVSEDEIAAAMGQLYRARGMVVEGAAGVAWAGFWKRRAMYESGRVAVVICGGNIAPDQHRAIVRNCG